MFKILNENVVFKLLLLLFVLNSMWPYMALHITYLIIIIWRKEIKIEQLHWNQLDKGMKSWWLNNNLIIEELKSLCEENFENISWWKKSIWWICWKGVISGGNMNVLLYWFFQAVASVHSFSFDKLCCHR